MKKKSWKSIALLIGCSIFLTGCIDNMPDLTQEQQSLVAQYAADLLLKYSSNYSDGLAQTEETELETETQELPTEETIETEEEQTSDTNDVSESNGNQGTGNEEGLTEAPIEQALALEQFEITYDDYEIDGAYPTDENAYFSISAEKGKKILVLHFTITNMDSADQECDIFTLAPKFRVNVNNQGYKQVMSTLLLDDLATYQDTIPANGESKVVLLLEMNESDTEEINSISVRTQNGDQAFMTSLF